MPILSIINQSSSVRNLESAAKSVSFLHFSDNTVWTQYDYRQCCPSVTSTSLYSFIYTSVLLVQIIHVAFVQHRNILLRVQSGWHVPENNNRCCKHTQICFFVCFLFFVLVLAFTSENKYRTTGML